MPEDIEIVKEMKPKRIKILQKIDEEENRKFAYIKDTFLNMKTIGWITKTEEGNFIVSDKSGKEIGIIFGVALEKLVLGDKIKNCPILVSLSSD